MDRTNSFARGLCSLKEAEEWSLDGFEPLDPVTHDILAVSRGMNDLLASEKGREVAYRLACAVLNTNFGDSGVLTSLDDKGNICSQYFQIGHVRKIQHSLVFGS